MRNYITELRSLLIKEQFFCCFIPEGVHYMEF
jgi:hypothetical protein